jgi:hypothetical protein
MIRFQLTHTIPCDVETYWKTFFDPAFNRELYLRTLGFPSWEAEVRETPTGCTRKVVAQPKMELPAPILKLIGPNLRYTEEGTFDRTRSTFTWTMKTSAMPDKLENSGVLRVEPAEPGSCRRIVDLTTKASVFGLGGMIESSTEKSLRDGWEASAAFHARWLASR